MKKNYILALFLTFVVVVVTYFVSKNNITDIAKVKDTFSENNRFGLNDISEQTDKYIIKAYIPYTNIPVLDEKLKNEISDILSNFKKDTENLKIINNDKKFELNVCFNNYEFDNYVSFLVFYTYDLGGAHPNKNCITINYNKKENTFVTIDTLISKDNNVLNKLSNYCFDDLRNKVIFNEKEDILKQVLFPEKKNFEKFVFSKEGIIIFFPSYSLMPYYMGEFEVIISYDMIAI